jgi:O-antigen/teichoic acid export membrane protein
MGPVWGLVAGSAAQAILFCAYRRDPRLFLPCLNDWRNVLRFGVYSSGTVIITSLNQWSPQVVLGRVLDFTAVGLYARSVNIMVMFRSPGHRRAEAGHPAGDDGARGGSGGSETVLP